MTQPGTQVFVHLRALQWTGSNGAAICELLTWQDQDGATYEVFDEIPNDYLQMAGRVNGIVVGYRFVYAHSPWVVINQADGSPDQMPQSSFDARYIAPPIGSAGPAGTITVGVTTTGAAGTNASVANTGTPSAAILGFTIPRGADGATPNLTIGTITALAPGATPTASITGTTPNLVLNLGIPSGGYLAGVTAQIPAATLLSVGTRTLAVAWPRTLPTATYDVDFLRDNTLIVGTPYTYAATAKTTTGFTLQYTNSAILTLGSGVLHCIAYK